LFSSEPLFYGWVSATAKLASGNMDYIKYHLEFNERITYFFGNQKGSKWTEVDIELQNGCKLISKSNISGIRGGAKLHKRYDLIILDDFEDENNTITAEARAKNSNLITAVVFPALEPHTGRLRINGTPVHFDSFINNLIVNYDKSKKESSKFSWDIICKKAIDENGVMLWDSWFGTKEMERKKKFYADSGQPSKFYQEYMMEVQSEEDAMFTRKHIKYWEGSYSYDAEANISYLSIDGKDIEPVNIFVGVDPATDSARREADYSVLLTIAVDMNNNIYVIDYIKKRGIPVLGIPGEDKLGIVDYMYQIEKQYHPTLFTVEDTAMSKPIFQALRAEARRRNNFNVRWKEEKPGNRMSKRDRIQEVLAQRFSIGQIHIKKDHHDLFHEIITFGPRMSHDDTIDALAYACKFSRPIINIVEEKQKFYRKKPTAKSWIVA
jgi:phage terminase large subunit-like protein